VSGEGQWVHTSLLEAQIFMLDFQAARWTMGKEVPPQVGNDHPTGVPTGTFKTKDGHINIAPTAPMWKKFCAAMGLDDKADHPDFATPQARRKNRARVHQMIEEVTATKDGATWIALLNEAGIPCGPIYTIDQTFADPQVRHLGIAQTVHSNKLGDITITGQPVTLSRTRSSLAVAAPEQGEHSDEVLGWLGYSADEIAALRGKKAL
jgi:formyl-CoA transferase